jgi:hypothetical protein
VSQALSAASVIGLGWSARLDQGDRRQPLDMARSASRHRIVAQPVTDLPWGRQRCRAYRRKNRGCRRNPSCRSDIPSAASRTNATRQSEARQKKRPPPMDCPAPDHQARGLRRLDPPKPHKGTWQIEVSDRALRRCFIDVRSWRCYTSSARRPARSIGHAALAPRDAHQGGRTPRGAHPDAENLLEMTIDAQVFRSARLEPSSRSLQSDIESYHYHIAMIVTQESR